MKEQQEDLTKCAICGCALAEPEYGACIDCLPQADRREPTTEAGKEEKHYIPTPEEAAEDDILVILMKLQLDELTPLMAARAIRALYTQPAPDAQPEGNEQLAGLNYAKLWIKEADDRYDSILECVTFREGCEYAESVFKTALSEKVRRIAELQAEVQHWKIKHRHADEMISEWDADITKFKQRIEELEAENARLNSAYTQLLNIDHHL